MLRNKQSKKKPMRMPRDLEKAIKNGDKLKATQLLSDPKYQSAMWINSVTRGNKTPLLLALKYNRDVITRLIMSNPQTDMNASYENGRTTTNAYNLCNDLDLRLELLHDTRTTLPPSPRFIYMALFDSRRRDVDFQIRMMQALIAKGVDVNTTHCGDASSLHWAAIDDRTEFARYLLSIPDIDVNKTCPIEKAAAYHRKEILELLLAHPDIDIEHKDLMRTTATRTWNGNTTSRDNCIKALLNHHKIARKHLTNPVMKWLLNENLELYRQVINLPNTEISVTLTKGDRYEVPKIKSLDVAPELHSLLNVLTTSPEFDVNMLIWNGHTLLTWVTEEYDASDLQILLDCDRINLHQQNASGNSALTLAANLGKQDMVEAIMSHTRFNSHATYRSQRNLLMHTAEHDCTDLMKQVLAGRLFPINATDTGGNTALILTANHHKDADDASIFLELMSLGANPEQRNNRGINAIMAAKNHGLKGIAHVLKHDKHTMCADNFSPSAPTFEQLFIEAVETPPQPSQQGIFAQNSEQHSNLTQGQLDVCKHGGPK